jgi:hypothetical protein
MPQEICHVQLNIDSVKLNDMDQGGNSRVHYTPCVGLDFPHERPLMSHHVAARPGVLIPAAAPPPIRPLHGAVLERNGPAARLRSVWGISCAALGHNGHALSRRPRTTGSGLYSSLKDQS